MEARIEDMGMTDRQFDSYQSALLEDLKEALELSPDNPKLLKMIARIESELKRP
jgi:hypothetical protein